MNDGILTIDVEAEIRKLSGQRFKSAGDYAVELIRFAAGKEPMLIDLKVTGSRFTLTHDGRGISMGTLKRLVTVFDQGRSPALRHRALVALEEEEGLGILAPFAVPKGRVSLSGTMSGKRRGVELSIKGGARSFDVSSMEDFCIEVKGGARKPAVERRLIEEACKYSILPIRLNGKRINNGPRVCDALLEVDIRNSRLHGSVGIPNKSDLTRIIRLKNGILVEDKLRPPVNGLVFHAVIDEKDDDFEASWNTLRRAARRLYQRMAGRYEELGDLGKERALSLLFDRYKHTEDPKLMNKVAAFRMVGRAPLDLDGVRRRSGRIYAIDLAEPVKGYDVEGRQVLRLTQAQRAFLEEIVGIPLLPPPSLKGRPGLKRRLIASVGHVLRSLGDLLGSNPGRPIRDNRLSPAEKSFLNAVSDEVRSGGFSLPGEARPFAIRVRMAQGQRKPWLKVNRKDGRVEYRISRNHPLVEKMIELVERDPSYIYPALIALADGHDGYTDTRLVHQQSVLARHGIS